MEKKKKTLLILGLCIFTLALVGLSYAFWQITLKQTDENLVYTDCLKLDFTEEHSIQLQNAYPMTYEERESFFASETPYHFTITNECNSKADLSINLETLPVEAEKTKLDDEWVDVILYEGNEDYIMYETPVLNSYESSELTKHYKLTANEINANHVIEETETAYTLYNFTIDKGATKDFSMYLYLDEETPVETESGKKTTNAEWKGKVTINAAYRAPVKNMIRKIADFDVNGYEGDTEGMWQYKNLVTKIVFENELSPHTEKEEIVSFDESMDKDESVMSYLVPNDDNPSQYTAYIQANGKIIANYDSSNLFYGFGSVTEIKGLEYLDTSKATNANHMFSIIYFPSGQSSLTTLDLSSLNTSQVTNMSYMFKGMLSLTSLTLGDNFDTSNVSDMSHMFDEVRSLAELKLPESFDTSNVIDMSGMFYGMRALTTLNLEEQFNTNNVTNMTQMFCGMRSLTTLNLGSQFNTSNVTSMSYMFFDMGSLAELNLGEQFNTSQVTNMSGMFSGMKSLTHIDYSSNFIHNKNADISGMFSNCPNELPKPDSNTHPSWEGVTWE